MSQQEKPAPKVKTPKPTDTEQVTDFMNTLDHPLKPELEAVRAIIKSNPKLSERIKWAAPSYYYKLDLVTFNLRSFKKVMLVFHHEAIVKITSDLLEGAYKDRRLIYFESMAEVKKNKEELERILAEYVASIDKVTT